MSIQADMSGLLAQLRSLSPELRLLIPLGLCAGLMVVFLGLAEDIIDNEPHKLDTRILLALRTSSGADPLGPPWLELTMTDITALGGLPVLLYICTLAIGYLLLVRRPLSACMVAVSVLGGMAANHYLKLGFDRPRPNLVPHLVDVHTLSFPSGHAMLSAVTYLTIGGLLARSRSNPLHKSYILGVAILTTLLIGTSRMYLGVHWPSDVLAGWCLGAGWAVFCLLGVDIMMTGKKK